MGQRSICYSRVDVTGIEQSGQRLRASQTTPFKAQRQHIQLNKLKKHYYKRHIVIRIACAAFELASMLVGRIMVTLGILHGLPSRGHAWPGLAS
jgi:hypothetical protein